MCNDVRVADANTPRLARSGLKQNTHHRVSQFEGIGLGAINRDDVRSFGNNRDSAIGRVRDALLDRLL